MDYYLNYYFNSSISILCDITLMKYLLSLSEMKDKFNILKIFNFSKIDIMMDFFSNELMNDDSKIKNNELSNKKNKEKKSLKLINSYVEFLLQIIRDNSSMINLCFKFSNIFKMKFKDKIMDKLIEKEKINFEKIITNEIIHFILGNKNIITREECIKQYQSYQKILNIDQILNDYCNQNNYNKKRKFSLKISKFQFCDLDYIINYIQRDNAFKYIKNFKSNNLLNTYFSTCLSIQNQLNNNIFDNFFNEYNIDNFINIFKMLIINEKYLKLNDIFLYIFSKIICVYLGFYKNNENKNLKYII